ncbi:right-handed parallel beta-helix repeat-containing protein [Pedobacter sp. SYP-B3415]|uniref:right-handed parallel beta-helix repeat-containing protein n=1 Tax=Pedobacter sp. SYP-B3415 TaxID=2496641 RepID=UPI00101C364F|nr:right-handed parallel beta-helix repeat-containing protein [Pedobacter sp. SYP-B3415]
MRTLLFILSLLLQLGQGAVAADIHVAPGGSDRNPGTPGEPLETLHAAVRAAREMRRLNDPAMKGGINILVHAGIYRLPEPLILRHEDSGTAESPTRISNFGSGEVILSGGMPVAGWKLLRERVPGLPAAAAGKVWWAPIPGINGRPVVFRQLWVNGKKARRAQLQRGGHMDRIISWNKTAETCTIAAPAGLDIGQLKGMEMMIHQWWAIANLRIKSVRTQGSSAVLSFEQPESRIQSEHPWPAPWISEATGNSAYVLSNALQFLDEPGEWYADSQTGRLYFWPNGGQDPASMTATVPLLETLLRAEGTLERPVQHIQISGLSFQHSTWLRPSQYGHVPHQAGMFMLDAYKLKKPGTADKKTLENQAWVGRPAAAVDIAHAQNLRIDSCRFSHMAATALDLRRATRENIITGNLFEDVGGSAILAGIFSDEATEVHIPFNPAHDAELSVNDRIENNLISDVTNEDWGCVGIGAGYVRGIRIRHNEIRHVNYTGISLGWGWTSSPNAMRNNLVEGNYIHHYGRQMYDVAGIYTLSAQPGTKITRNRVDSIYKAPYAHLPEHWFYLYSDEGSAGMTVSENWTPAEKYLQNANGSGNRWAQNGPQVPAAIREAAGLQNTYHYLRQGAAAYPVSQPVNLVSGYQGKAVIYQLEFRKNRSSAEAFKAFCREKGLPSTVVYTWKNRIVMYVPAAEQANVSKSIATSFPDAEVIVFDDLVYDFNRQKYCGVKPALRWKHHLLSASLVDDEELQQQYIEDHRTQFAKWPEVARGFCRAQFQQLLVFKHGRQLMLVISIPEHEQLNQLNPLTAKDNPRVDQWNERMKKYQEGIPGSAVGETWVEFLPLQTEEKKDEH